MKFKVGQKVIYNIIVDENPITGVGEITFVHPGEKLYLVKLDVPAPCTDPFDGDSLLMSTLCKEEELQPLSLTSNKEWSKIWEEN